MLRKLATVASFIGMAFVASDATAIPLHEWGTGNNPNDWDAPKVAPRTACRTLMLYAAAVPADENAMRRYRFTGECTFNVARRGKVASMRTVDVLIDAEWSPRMKRASERIVVEHPDLTVNFSTWATCTADPFTASRVDFGATNCSNKGMGASKFSAFISRDDAPFASGRSTNVSGAVARVGANQSKLWQNPTISRVQPIGIRTTNDVAYVAIDVAGGAGICPMVVDFGDGETHKLLLWGNEGTPFRHQVAHTFKKPGAFKVKARALPGCSGTAQVYAIVK